jgi:hypothetical protein
LDLSLFLNVLSRKNIKFFLANGLLKIDLCNQKDSLFEPQPIKSIIKTIFKTRLSSISHESFILFYSVFFVLIKETTKNHHTLICFMEIFHWRLNWSQADCVWGKNKHLYPFKNLNLFKYRFVWNYTLSSIGILLKILSN